MLYVPFVFLMLKVSPTAASDIQRSTRDDTDAQSKTGKEPVNGPHSDDSATPEQLHIGQLCLVILYIYVCV